MTDNLHTLLHDRAEQADFAPVDLAAITRDGARVVRRRRIGSVAAGAAAAVLVGGLGVVALQSRSGDDTGVAVGVLDAAQVSWATGSVLHTPTDQVDVGHEIDAYVRTAAGFAFVSDDTVYSYVDGRVRGVGSLTGSLRGDPYGDLVAWVDPTGDRPAVVVLDQSSGETTRFDDYTDAATEVYAVSYRFAYWRDERGAVAVDLVQGDEDATVLSDRPAGAFDVLSAFGSVIAAQSDDGIVVARGGDDVTVPGVADASGATFSPDGRFVSIGGISVSVADRDTDRVVDVDLPDGRATGVEWLDDQQLVVVSQALGSSTSELLVCDVSSGGCDPTGAVLGGDFELPLGEPLELD